MNYFEIKQNKGYAATVQKGIAGWYYLTLNSTFGSSVKALDQGFVFVYDTLEGAFKKVLEFIEQK